LYICVFLRLDLCSASVANKHTQNTAVSQTLCLI